MVKNATTTASMKLLGGDSIIGLGDISADIDIIENACVIMSIVDELYTVGPLVA